jgi:hypothetical protein
VGRTAVASGVDTDERQEPVNAGNWIALLAVVASILLTVGGWSVGHLLTRLRAADTLVATQRDIIDDLKRQVFQLAITAEITAKFFDQLPRQPTNREGQA